MEIQLLIEDKFGIAVDWRDILRCRSVSSLAYFLCSRDYQDAQPHKQAAFNGVTFCYRVIGSLNANSVPKLIIGGGFQDMYSLPHLESLLASDGPLIFVDVPGPVLPTTFRRMPALLSSRPASIKFSRSRPSQKSI
ncbi:hypothetical protein HGG75_24955 [Ochrobactrum pseudogrignonense]|nr:hypothetical protein [Brucella pseudogrignonensis]